MGGASRCRRPALLRPASCPGTGSGVGCDFPCLRLAMMTPSMMRRWHGAEMTPETNAWQRASAVVENLAIL